MQVGISQLVLGNLPCDEFFKKASATGYEVVEVCLRREGEISLAMDHAAKRRILDQADAAGIKMISMVHSHCTGNLLDSGEARERGIQETVRGLRLAADMGIGCTLHTLGSLRSDLYYDEAFGNAVVSLQAIGKEAEKLGVDVAIEFVWNGFLFSPLETRCLLDEVASPSIGFYFDPGNMAVFHFPHHWVRVLGSHVKMVHMKDWKGGALNGAWTALLAGQVDFPAVLAELRAAGYDNPLISEVEPSLASLEDTAQAIRKIIEM